MNININTNNLKYALNTSANKNHAALKPMRTSFSLSKLSEFINMYTTTRKEAFPTLKNILYFIETICSNKRLRILENDKGEIIAGYTYKLRKNKLEEKSLYIDGLARNRNNPVSKSVMTNVYNDIKKFAEKKKRKEITLFVYVKERRLRDNYQKLGFEIDHKCNLEKVYLLRVRLENFLNNGYFKLREYKEARGLNNIIQNFPFKNPNV